MVVIQRSSFISNLIPFPTYLHLNRNLKNGRRPRILAFARKEDDLAKKSSQKTQQSGDPKFSISKVLIQVGIGVLTLGFIDAGYSGDWSRIGVISKEGEDLLKAAAFLVVPLSAYLIYMISKEQEAL